MSLTSESNIEIEATISITNNDFSYTCNVSPVPDLTTFDNVKVYYNFITCYDDIHSDLSHRNKDFTNTVTNSALPKLISCAGEYTEGYIWYFNFSESSYSQVINILNSKGVNYTEISNTTPSLAIIE
tara:strand:- start:229 stop:609 length:381 start_codon:yes stop_codon:yes gene_type:complete